MSSVLIVCNILSLLKYNIQTILIWNNSGRSHRVFVVRINLFSRPFYSTQKDSIAKQSQNEDGGPVEENARKRRTILVYPDASREPLLNIFSYRVECWVTACISLSSHPLDFSVWDVLSSEQLIVGQWALRNESPFCIRRSRKKMMQDVLEAFWISVELEYFSLLLL